MILTSYFYPWIPLTILVVIFIALLIKKWIIWREDKQKEDYFEEEILTQQLREKQRKQQTQNDI